MKYQNSFERLTSEQTQQMQEYLEKPFISERGKIEHEIQMRSSETRENLCQQLLSLIQNLSPEKIIQIGNLTATHNQNNPFFGKKSSQWSLSGYLNGNTGLSITRTSFASKESFSGFTCPHKDAEGVTELSNKDAQAIFQTYAPAYNIAQQLLKLDTETIREITVHQVKNLVGIE